MRNYETSTGNIWLLLTMGGDCSRWYLRKKNKQKEGERAKIMSVLFSSIAFSLMSLLHMAAKSTSELVSAEVVGPEHGLFIQPHL